MGRGPGCPPLGDVEVTEEFKAALVADPSVDEGNSRNGDESNCPACRRCMARIRRELDESPFTPADFKGTHPVEPMNSSLR